MQLELVKNNSEEEVLEYTYDKYRTIPMNCPGCGNHDRFTVHEANEGIPCKRCRK